jgi:ribonuclease G
LVKELIIDATPGGATIAILQDKQLVELHKEQISNNYAVGDIYLGKIKKIMPGLNAAFVDVGYEKDAFLHYLDLGPQVLSLLKLSKLIRGGSYQAKLLDNFKLEAEIGIIRTVSEEKGVIELQQDLLDLVSKWETFVARLPATEPSKKVLGEIDRTSTILRDLLNPDFQSIHVNDLSIFEEIRTYVHQISPDLENIVKMHKHKDPIFEHFGIEKQIKGAFGKTVNLAGGAYLVIEHTEALHVIDVNSGNRTANKENQETNAFQVNKEAAKEIARQLRLRDMGGIVVVDFIDMHKPTNRKDLFDYLRDEMLLDRAKHTILPPSKFGLVQITRQRVRPEMNIVTTEVCPTCNGTGTIRPTILLLDDIETNFNFILIEQNEKNITLCVHPYIEAYIKKGIYNRQMKWFFKYNQWIKVSSNPNYQITEFHFQSAKGEEIKL